MASKEKQFDFGENVRTETDVPGFSSLEPRRGQIEYPLDPQSEGTLKLALERVLPEVILKATWEKFLLYIDAPAITDATNLLGTWAISSSGGTFSNSSASLVLNSGGTNGNNVSATKNFLTGSTILDWDKPQRFRTQFRFSGITSLIAYITRGDVNAADNEYFGFRVAVVGGNLTLQGVARDGVIAEQTINLLTVLNTTTYNIEAILIPGQEIVFKVNDEERGVLLTGIPFGGAPIELFGVDLETTATEAQKTLTVGIFEFTQQRSAI